MQNTMKANRSASGLHIARLDTIRFLAALWVAISHGTIPLKPLANSGALRLAFAFIQDSFSGVAAVMVFFIVSGLCIHLPYSGRSAVPLLPFLARRFLRVGLPLAVILLLAHLAGEDGPLRAVTWSVYAELFYYSIYPLLFRMAQRWGWMPQIAISSVIAAAISVWFVRETLVSNLGWPAWLWGLPIWISGCLMADWLCGGRVPPISGPLWAWRILAWIISIAATWLVFHSPIKIGYQFSMLVFALVASSWLAKELTSGIEAWNALERCGAASYSLYLVHPVVLAILAQHRPQQLSASVDIFLSTSTVAIATTAFYLAIEAPSHRLARYVSRTVDSFGVNRSISGRQERVMRQLAHLSNALGKWGPV
jgi:peptidoglycan/LPS O-acetylase OafA/YrhL